MPALRATIPETAVRLFQRWPTAGRKGLGKADPNDTFGSPWPTPCHTPMLGTLRVTLDPKRCPEISQFFGKICAETLFLLVPICGEIFGGSVRNPKVY
jgi:hypothetical protein